MEANSSKENKENIQVVLRCRPMNEEEKKGNHGMSVKINKDRKEVGILQSIAGKEILRNYTFDHAFGRDSTQKEIYESAIKPIVAEVLKGFNCTVFAYGQTGTGKTYTMEGDRTFGSEHAGVIPRAVNQIFGYLESAENEYSVKVSYLELYNEELVDLLVNNNNSNNNNNNNDETKVLRIFEDSSGKKGVAVSNMEEIIVGNAKDIFNILDSAYVKRTTAETALNKQSSRSHGIFTITLHIKETTPEGEELMKIGKLNLVDLAGSENIGRSKAVNQRAREAGMINQSLLTLGRVITALTEGSSHIPYRESKLTRILQESLGGRTKTCIVATVSPSNNCLEETISTLDYAHRAKSIKNRPELNQKMTKRAYIKDVSIEIDKLKMELYSARQKDGVFLPHDHYLAMESKIKTQEEQISELESLISMKLKEISEVKELFDSKKKELDEEQSNHKFTKEELQSTQIDLKETTENLTRTKNELEEHCHLLDNYKLTETNLHCQGSKLIHHLSSSVHDLGSLHSKLERNQVREIQNNKLREEMKTKVESQCQSTISAVKDVTNSVIEGYDVVESKVDAVFANVQDHFDTTQSKLSLLSTTIVEFNNQLKLVSNEFRQSYIDETSSVKQKMAQNMTDLLNLSQLFQSSLLESFASIQQSCSASAQEFSVGRDQMTTHLINLKDSIHSQVSQQSQTMATYSNDVKQTTGEVTKMMEEESRRCDEILKRRNESMSSLKQNLLQDIQKMLQVAFAAEQEELTKEMSPIMSTFERESQVIRDFQSRSDANEKQFQQTAEEMINVTDTMVDSNCLPVLTAISHNHQNLVEEVIGFVSVSEEKTSDFVDNQLNRSFASHCDFMKNAIEKSEKVICEEYMKGEIEDKYLVSLESVVVKKRIEEMKQENVEFVDSISNEQIAVLKKEIGNQRWKSKENDEKKLESLVSQVSDTVLVDYFSNVKEDVKTNTTPQRKRIDFSKKLSKTADHEKILKEFRNWRAESSENGNCALINHEIEVDVAVAVAVDANVLPQKLIFTEATNTGNEVQPEVVDISRATEEKEENNDNTSIAVILSSGTTATKSVTTKSSKSNSNSNSNSRTLPFNDSTNGGAMTGLKQPRKVNKVQ